MSTLDTSIEDSCDALEVVDKPTISMYVSGGKGSYSATLEVSPDEGVTWFTVGNSLHETGVVTVQVAATHARVRIEETSADVTSIEAFLVAA